MGKKMSDKVDQNKENQGTGFDQFKVNPEEAKDIKGGVSTSLEDTDGKRCFRCEGYPEWQNKKDCLAHGGTYVEIPCPTNSPA